MSWEYDDNDKMNDGDLRLLFKWNAALWIFIRIIIVNTVCVFCL